MERNCLTEGEPRESQADDLLNRYFHFHNQYPRQKRVKKRNYSAKYIGIRKKKLTCINGHGVATQRVTMK